MQQPIWSASATDWPSGENWPSKYAMVWPSLSSPSQMMSFSVSVRFSKLRSAVPVRMSQMKTYLFFVFCFFGGGAK